MRRHPVWRKSSKLSTGDRRDAHGNGQVKLEVSTITVEKNAMIPAKQDAENAKAKMVQLQEALYLKQGEEMFQRNEIDRYKAEAEAIKRDASSSIMESEALRKKIMDLETRVTQANEIARMKVHEVDMQKVENERA